MSNYIYLIIRKTKTPGGGGGQKTQKKYKKSKIQKKNYKIMKKLFCFWKDNRSRVFSLETRKHKKCIHEIKR